MVIGPQRRVTCFHAPSTISFGELRRNIQELLPFFSMVEFDVYTEAAVQSVVEQKNVLAGLELQEVGFWAHACSVRTMSDKLGGAAGIWAGNVSIITLTCVVVLLPLCVLPLCVLPLCVHAVSLASASTQPVSDSTCSCGGQG